MAGSYEYLRQTYARIPARYDDVRPAYPAEVVDAAVRRVARAAPLRVLEIGCGTGQATRLLAERGHQVLATDLSADLLALAAHNLADYPNLRFEAAAFEDLAAPDGSFDLIVSAQAFHWIDPAIGVAKAGSLLAPGGVLALFWNFVNYDATPLLRQLRDACATQIPVFAGWPDASSARFIAFGNYWRAAVSAAPSLDFVIETFVPNQLAYSHEKFLALVATYSWFLIQPAPIQSKLIDQLRDILAFAPEPLMLPIRTTLITAVKPAS